MANPFLLVALLVVATGTTQASIKLKTPIQISLRSDLATRKNSSFAELLDRWQKRYGARAVDPLIEIAADSAATSDPDRYVALMGAAKLGGYATAPRIAKFLGDPSWMIRSGSLRLLGALHDESFAPEVVPLLRDPALVVRLEAVATVEKLRAPGAADALVTVLTDRANYHGGKALWVPERALQALVNLQAREMVPRLLPLLEHGDDPRLLQKTVAALDALTGRWPTTTPTTDEGLKDRVAAWKAELARMPQTDSLTEHAAAPVTQPQ